MNEPHQPWSTPEVIAALSKEPFGEKLAESLWEKFQDPRTNLGIYNNHRYYCGLNLIKATDSGIGLYINQDDWGWDVALHEMQVGWRNRETFVTYWSQQSDYGLSGADPAHPEIRADNDFALNNQRITRKLILEFVSQPPPLPDKQRHPNRVISRPDFSIVRQNKLNLWVQPHSFTTSFPPAYDGVFSWSGDASNRTR